MIFLIRLIFDDLKMPILIISDLYPNLTNGGKRKDAISATLLSVVLNYSDWHISCEIIIRRAFHAWIACGIDLAIWGVYLIRSEGFQKHQETSNNTFSDCIIVISVGERGEPWCITRYSQVVPWFRKPARDCTIQVLHVFINQSQKTMPDCEFSLSLTW